MVMFWEVRVEITQPSRSSTRRCTVVFTVVCQFPYLWSWGQMELRTFWYINLMWLLFRWQDFLLSHCKRCFLICMGVAEELKVLNQGPLTALLMSVVLQMNLEGSRKEYCFMSFWKKVVFAISLDLHESSSNDSDHNTLKRNSSPHCISSSKWALSCLYTKNRVSNTGTKCKNLSVCKKCT